MSEHEDAGTGGSGVGPSPSMTPADAVRAQLDALESHELTASAELTGSAEGDGDGVLADGDVPASVRTLFDFAAPEFRAVHGSLDGFAATFRGAIYDRLVAATSIERGPGGREDDRFVQSVLARHPDGDRTYEFVLARQRGGKYDGCWMTRSVDLVYDGESPTFRRTPTVTFGDRELACEVGDDLRSVLLAAEGYSPHNDVAQVANCGGNGLCGTCAVDVDGDVDEMGDREAKRLSLPPHDSEDGLRLACQTCVRGDVTVRKHEGLWGQHVERFGDDGDEADPTDANPADAVDAEPTNGSTESADPADAVEVSAAEYAGEYEYASRTAGGAR